MSKFNPQSVAFIKTTLQSDITRQKAEVGEMPTLSKMPVRFADLMQTIVSSVPEKVAEARSSEVGTDEIQYLSLRNDFSVIRSSLKNMGDADGVRSATFQADGWCCFRVRLRGDIRESFGIDEKIYRNFNASFVNFGVGEEYSYEAISAQAIDGISIMFRRSFLVEKMRGEMSRAIQLLDLAGDENAPAHCRHWLSLAISKNLLKVAKEILAADENMPYFKLWIEAKAMELLTLGLSNLEYKYADVSTLVALKPQEIRQARLVQELLDSQYLSPPTTDEICQKVGMSRRRLFFCFKQYFGKTVTEYLQSLRMINASQLLSQGLPISIVAERVGYLDQGSFTKVFKRHFGVLPRHYHSA
jgi:AraC-like DNA-binding protein